MDVQDVLGDHGDAFGLQVIDEAVLRFHVHGGEAVHHLAAAEHLGLHALAPGAELDHLVASRQIVLLLKAQRGLP